MLEFIALIVVTGILILNTWRLERKNKELRNLIHVKEVEKERLKIEGVENQKLVRRIKNENCQIILISTHIFALTLWKKMVEYFPTLKFTEELERVRYAWCAKYVPHDIDVALLRPTLENFKESLIKVKEAIEGIGENGGSLVNKIELIEVIEWTIFCLNIDNMDNPFHECEDNTEALNILIQKAYSDMLFVNQLLLAIRRLTDDSHVK